MVNLKTFVKQTFYFESDCYPPVGFVFISYRTFQAENQNPPKPAE